MNYVCIVFVGPFMGRSDELSKDRKGVHKP